MMKTRNYYRPSTVSLGKKKRVVRRKKGTRFLLKIFLLLLGLLFIIAGGRLAVTKGYQLLTRTNLSSWHVKKVTLSGVAEPLYSQVLSQMQPYTGQPLSAQQAGALRQTLMQQYPTLKQVRVKRGLLSGTLTVSAQRGTAIAQFKTPDGRIRYIDADSTVYTDTQPADTSSVLLLELEGPVPDKLNTEFVELVQSALKLRKELDFAFLRLNVADNTVKMYMPDGSVIDFGTAVRLKKKAARAAQIMALAREKYPAPFVLNFRFFENGKVFLTQGAH